MKSNHLFSQLMMEAEALDSVCLKLILTRFRGKKTTKKGSSLSTAEGDLIRIGGHVVFMTEVCHL